jgi:hypothetical protein
MACRLDRRTVARARSPSSRQTVRSSRRTRRCASGSVRRSARRPRRRPLSPPLNPSLTQPQPSRSRRLSANGPVPLRLVWSGWPGEIEGVRVRNVNTQTYSSVRPTERLAADIREAFARFVAEDIVAAVCPVSGTSMGPLVSSAELLTVTEGLLDPRLLAAEVVRVIVQVAAVHAGIPPFVARLMGQAAGDLFTELASPDPDSSEVRQCSSWTSRSLSRTGL